MLTLVGAKKIAGKKNLPYQRLIVQAVERLIDEEEKKEAAKPEAKAKAPAKKPAAKKSPAKKSGKEKA